MSSGLSDVIEIQTDKLTTMGLNSLKDVTGPGNIVMQFNRMNQQPTDSTQRGEKCFTEQEIRFLAYNPQFIGYLYKGCDSEDPCYAQDLFYLSQHLSRNTRAYDVPANCSIYYGSIIFTENSYISEGNYALQLIEVTSAPFLVNFSIPSLNNSRSLKWSYQSGTQMSTSTGVLERVKDPCPQMEQFKKGENCERIYATFNTYQPDEELISFLYWEYLLTEIFSIFGIVINFRAMLMLISIGHGHLLPSSRYLLALIVTVNCLVGLERAIVYQREIKVRYNDYRAGGPSFYYMPILQSSILITPLLKWFSSACVGFKHAALVLVPLCYLDYAVFFGSRHRLVPKISTFLTTIGLASFVSLSIYFYYQLFIFTRIGSLEPNEQEFGKSAKYFFFLVLHENGKKGADLLGGLEPIKMANQFDALQFNDFSKIRDFVDLVPDSLGLVFPSFVFYLDMITAFSTFLFYILYRFGRITSGHSCWVLLFLYLELSVNRIRWYLRNDVLFDGYCPKEQQQFTESICGTENDYNFWVMKLLEKITYISALLAAVISWKFAKYHLYLGAAIYLQNSNGQRRREANSQEDVSFQLHSSTKKTMK